MLVNRQMSSGQNPLRFVSAVNVGPSSTQNMNVASAAAVDFLSRNYFVIGSGNVSQIVLSFYAWFLQQNSGVNNLGNGYTIDEVAIEYNSTFKPVTFSGGRTKVIANGDTDIQSDPLLASAFGLSSFAQGTTGYIRMRITIATPATDKMPVGNSPTLVSTKVKYDTTKVSVTNGVDSTGEIAYSMINGGVNGVDAIFCNPFLPVILGRYITGDPPTWILAGDSKTYGTGDAGSAQGVFGLSRAMFPNAALAAGAYSNWNIGCPSGIGNDWAGGTPSKLTGYLKYARYAVEHYGTNSLTIAQSTAIHATLRANGIQHIVVGNLRPRTTSTDTWITEANQTIVANWGPAVSTLATFETALQALVAADLTYFDATAMLGVDPYKWVISGAANYATADGIHPTPAGYELQVGSNGSIIRQSGTTTNTLRSVIAALT